MRKLALIFAFIVGALVGGGIIHAVNFTVVLTQGEVDIAAWKWNDTDPAHTSFSTNQLYGEFAVRNTLIGEWRGQRRAYRIRVVGEPTGYFCTNTWPGLSQGTKDSLCTGSKASGGLADVAGCTPCSADGS